MYILLCYVIMDQLNVYKLGKEYVKAVYCHLAYLTYMQSTSHEMPGWMKHKLESRLVGEILAYVLESWKKLELKIGPRFGNEEIVNIT